MSAVVSPFETQAAHYAKVARECHAVSSELWHAAQGGVLPEGYVKRARRMSCVLADHHRQALRLVAQLDQAAAWDMENRRSGDRNEC